LTVAVATNFLEPLRRITLVYEKESGNRLRVVSGSTGGLYAKIRKGAPYDVFFAADQARPKQLADEMFGAPTSRFTYAIGRLALWGKLVGSGETVGPTNLRAGAFDHLAIANPALAPYGAATMQVLRALGVDAHIQNKLVYGQNIGQTYQFVATGGAAFGFVALSQLRSQTTPPPKGAWWVVPDTLHTPIRQDVIALTGRSNVGRSNIDHARRFLTFLRTNRVRSMIQSLGYDVPALGYDVPALGYDVPALGNVVLPLGPGAPMVKKPAGG
jgi:molybdate transport system substrate-binding protein